MNRRSKHRPGENEAAGAASNTASVPSSRALILGLGQSGMAMARWLAREGWQLRVADTRAEPPMLAALRQEMPQAEFRAGNFEAELLEGVARVAISPGLPPHRAPVAPLLQAARKARVPLAGEIELFAQALARLRAERDIRPRLIGVTGTNGKTTTTSLVGAMVRECGFDVAVAGNIAPAALDVLAQRLDAGHLPDVWVLELSSFQLQTTTTLACDAAAILNLTEDHLDWHGSMEHYAQAKARILARGTVAVLNRADAAVMALAPPAAKVCSFGPDAPQSCGQFGLVHDRGIDWLALAEDPEQRPARARGAPAREGQQPGSVYVRRLMPSDALAIHGRHNAMNALAALALVRAIGCPLGPALQALRRYRGEAHRTERVAIVDGVEYYDDSKGTNVGATLAAIEGLAREGRRLVVILGGDGKGQRFDPLAPAVAAHARAVLLIGRDGTLIQQALQAASDASNIPLVAAATLPEAVQRASDLARPGDAVLLSPACASFDMFRDYAHRAQVFVQAVMQLPQAARLLCG
ncbi:MAG: UDP-N-acetylmuramoyl-L-alanine--D-glutamate ligase [Burkholderiaceae bacterium]|nr:UDP-N-acetylmuramoyl-L-alanine--D-glutamate ligase [Burkholderiaceae bacterium]